MANNYKRCYDGVPKEDFYYTGIKDNSSEEGEVKKKRVKEITWILDEESYSSDSYSLSYLKSINLCNENFVPTLKYPYLEQLMCAILHKNGDSKFYLAQDHLRGNSFIFHIVEELQDHIVSIMKDAKRHNKLKETVLLLHSIYSLLHNNKLPFSFIDKLKDSLMFNLINPASRCNSCSHCYLLQDIIADIIATLFEKYSTEKSWEDTIMRLDFAFNCTSPFFVQYGAIALSLSSETCMKEFSSVNDDAKEQLHKDTFLAALKNTPSRQSAVNVRDKLLLVFKRWIEHWLHSNSSDCDSSNIKFLTGLNLCSAGFPYFCKDEYLQYCILPSKYMCHRMPPKINPKPFASLSYLIIPSKRKLDAIFKTKSVNYPLFGTKMVVDQEECSNEEEDPILSQWSDKVNLKVSSCGVYLNDSDYDDDSKKRSDVTPPFVTDSDDSEKRSDIITFPVSPSRITDSDCSIDNSYNQSPVTQSVNSSPISNPGSPPVTDSVNPSETDSANPSVSDSIHPVTDSVNPVADSVNPVADSVNSVTDSVNSVTDSVNPSVTNFESPSPIANSPDTFSITTDFHSVKTNSGSPSPEKAIFEESMDYFEEIKDATQPMNEVPPVKKPSISFEHTSTYIFELTVSVCSRKDKHFEESAEIF